MELKIELSTYDDGRVEALMAWPNPVGVNGCPMGRGRSKESAIKDLLYRISYESPTVKATSTRVVLDRTF